MVLCVDDLQWFPSALSIFLLGYIPSTHMNAKGRANPDLVAKIATEVFTMDKMPSAIFSTSVLY